MIHKILEPYFIIALSKIIYVNDIKILVQAQMQLVKNGDITNFIWIIYYKKYTTKQYIYESKNITLLEYESNIIYCQKARKCCCMHQDVPV